MTENEPRFRDVFVTSVMSESIEAIEADAPATVAARQLFETDVGSLLVGAESPPPAGILTESDFVELAADERDPATTSVEDCMSSPVVTVPATASLEAAAQKMDDHGIKKLPVVEDTGGVVGVITTTDIAKYVPVHDFHPEQP